MKNIKTISNNVYKSLSIAVLLFGSFFLFSTATNAQSITMTDGGNDQACGGTFFDPGGTGNYSGGNNTYTHTICSSTPGEYPVITFTSFQLWAGSFLCGKEDKLEVYDGPNTGSPLKGTYTEDDLQGQQIIGTSGCLTFKFITVQAGGFMCSNNPGEAGWEATISCTTDLPATGENCIESISFCSNQNYDFPNQTSGSAPSGPDYGCLGSQPNPIWYHLKIGQSGSLQLDLEQQNTSGGGIDIDFALWGPFTDIPSGCSQIMGGGLAPLQCSYSASATETIGIGMQGGYSSGQSTPPNAQAGEYYILLLTNYSGQAGNIMLEQTSGTGETDCSILVPCDISDITTNVSACNPSDNTFSVSGDIVFADAPTTGDLIVEDCNGNSVTYSAPFTSPISYTIPGIAADGATCQITAHFTDEPLCSKTSADYQNPVSCACNPPVLTIVPINECGNNIDLNNGIDPSSDAATKTFYNTQADATNATNPIGNMVSTGGSYWVRAEDPNDPTCFDVYEITVNTATLSYTAVLTEPACGNSDGEMIISASGGTTPYTYSIDYGGNNDQNTNGTFSNLPAGTYDITITDDNGCSVTGDTTLNSSSSADPSFDFDDFCEGATNGPNNIVTPGGTFSFSPAVSDGATIDGTTGTISNGVGGTTYTVEYLLSGACPSSETVDVTVWENPAFTLGHTDPTCGNADGSITITGLTPSSNYDVNYDTNGTPVGVQNLTTDGAGDIVLNNLPFGSYTNFEISNSNGCSTSNATGIDLIEIGAPAVTAPTDIDICLGESTTLTADNPDGATITWNNGITDGVAFTPSSSGAITYTVTAENSAGCSATDQVTVTVHDSPVVDAGADQTICEGNPATLTATGATTYNWNGIGGGATQTVTPNTTTTYEVTGTDDYGCENTDQVVVTVSPIPVPDFEADIREGCEPLTVNFTNLSGFTGGTCKWDFGDGTTGVLCNNVTHTYQNGGTYSVSLTITDAIGCSGTYTEQDYIAVRSKPEAMFTADPMVTGTSDPEVTFTNGSHNGTDFTWIFGDDSSPSHAFDTTHIYPDDEEGTYIVTLIASNGPDCNDTVKAIIKIEEELIFYIPNTFTPDNDEHNETFRPIFTSGFDPQTYTFEIYNRWGEILFESHDTNVGWNGTYGTGTSKIVKQGTYIWKIKIKETGKDKHNTYTGHVNLLR